MPTYEYRCESCAHQLEIFHKISESAQTRCPACGQNSLKRGVGGGIGFAFASTATPSKDPAPSGGCCPCGKNKGSCSTS